MSELTSLATATKAKWLEALDPRGRLIATLVFAIAVVAIEPLFLLMLACGFSLSLMVASKLPFDRLMSRLIPFECFMLVLVLFIPFTVTGTSAGELFGLLPVSENGIERAIQVFLRANAILLCSLTLLASMLPETTGHALARLKVPHKLVHLYLMTVRYVSVLGQEYQRLRTAMRARAFAPGSNMHTWRSYGWLIGMLLVRSLERSERVLQAMKCRGYQGRYLIADESEWRVKDTVFLVMVTGFSVTLVVLHLIVVNSLESVL
ncbi:cobalt ECF transporter T component CbiQ [Litoribrevibacter albus]|uniref:Cobalt ECF transporter T component CbiQ n=1 Tax=Litoribrevibacter albus TaxID=1473156 RepID=A0AA37S993_9GAMM|nr:cobalt ECF transporter T component CbiQ [Litoribrevibacter albus]GLQ30804.1 hypothetical protein GCM10007876_12830 [Litoribrevibacter albus]